VVIEAIGDGVRIVGDASDLLALAMWVRIAVEQGKTEASYSSGGRTVRFEVVCTNPLPRRPTSK
jgi:hypothetical protein